MVEVNITNIKVMLDQKLKKAAQAIVKNNSILIASGSGMAAESKVVAQKGWNPVDGKYEIPTFRGTYGLWKHFPALKRHLIGFE